MDQSTLHYVPCKLRLCILVIAAGLALPVAAIHENDASSGEAILTDQTTHADVAGNQDEPIEEITVIGQQLILTLRQEIYLAEDRAFEIFNRLNNDDLFDVVCVMEARTGSLIKRRMCHPNFYHRATQNNALEFLGSLGGCSDISGSCASLTNYVTATPSARNEVSRQFPMFKDKVKALAMKNPELKDAMQELFELTKELNSVRNSYHGTETASFIK